MSYILGFLCRLRKCWTDSHERFVPYEVQQMVGLKVHLPGNLNKNKFHPRYHGPYEIVQVNDNKVTYVLKSPGDGRQYKSHHRQLRLWKMPPDYLRNNPTFQRYALNEDLS